MPFFVIAHLLQLNPLPSVDALQERFPTVDRELLELDLRRVAERRAAEAAAPAPAAPEPLPPAKRGRGRPSSVAFQKLKAFIDANPGRTLNPKLLSLAHGLDCEEVRRTLYRNKEPGRPFHGKVRIAARDIWVIAMPRTTAPTPPQAAPEPQERP